MSEQNENVDNQKVYTREEVQAFLDDIGEKVIASNEGYIHSVVALNQLLRLPNAEELFDDDLKAQMRDLWIKLKSLGIQLNDPPLLFGLPEDFGKEEEVKDEEEEEGEEDKGEDEKGEEEDKGEEEPSE